MKVTREEADANRQALITEAGKLFRAKGFDGVGVAELSKAAGLTHGALYAQFGSKEALAAAAFEAGSRRSEVPMKREAEQGGLDAALDFYLNKGFRDDLGGGCSMAASASEIARLPQPISEVFAGSFERMVAIIESTLNPKQKPKWRNQRATAIASSLIGAMAASRGVQKANPGLADEILRAAKVALMALSEAP